MRLSPNFTLAELTRSAAADRARIDNTPAASHLANLTTLASALEQIRALLGSKPMVISSGYRSPALNKVVGGSSTSDHSNGLAADFTCPAFGSVRQVCEAIKASGLRFDQLIYEQGGTGWVHIGIGTRMRREVLSWAPGQGYVNGLVGLVK